MNGLDTIVDFINSNREWLIYVPTMLFVLILFIWTFVGFIRGSRRSSYAFLMMVIAIAVSAGIYFYFLLLIVCPLFSPYLSKIEKYISLNLLIHRVFLYIK